MPLEILAMVRDCSVLLLVLEGFVLLLLPLLVLWQVTRGLRRFIPKTALVLHEIQQKVFRILDVIRRIMTSIRAPFVWIVTGTGGMRAFLTSMYHILHKGR